MVVYVENGFSEIPNMASTTEFSADDYFRTQPPPPTLENDLKGVREFLELHIARGNRVVLVTVSSEDHLICVRLVNGIWVGYP